jgi:hypothetical protein
VKTAVFALIAALNLLSSPAQTAGVAVGASVADSLLDKSVIEPVHYSRRYGWQCHGQGHKESCHRTGGYREESRYGASPWRFGAGGRPVEN